ncbi:MAG: hypothetical protein CME65_12640 [Halobacteriovoraceae bacterium]|nr:hypothetical protein [Halobacteriovoraceae bacterium]
MNFEIITETLKGRINIGVEKRSGSDSINLKLINRNIELKLEEELNDIETELSELTLILGSRSETYNVYGILLTSLRKEIFLIRDLFESKIGLDDIEVSLILEKIKTKLSRLDRKMDVVSGFAYPYEQQSA